MKSILSSSIGSLLLLAFSSVQAADPLYPAPNGGWTYLYEGDERQVGTDTGWDWLDGTWSHDNGSDQFDGSEIGGTFGDSNRPGGVSLLTQGDDTFLRMQDTGDPRDYAYGDPGSNRKVYFGHNIADEIDATIADTILDDGVTLTFRGRIPTEAKASIGGEFLIDPLHPDGGSGIVDYPVDGDGYVTWDSGKGNFVIRQFGDGTPDHPGGALAFSLTVPDDYVNDGDPANFAGLTMNEKNGNVPSGDVDFGEGTATNLVAFDPSDWHEIYMVIHKDPANIATHEVFIFWDGGLAPLVFKLTAGTGTDVNSDNFIAMGGPATGQNWALDVDWFGLKEGMVFPPGSIDKLPPSITEVSIPENAMFQPTASGLSWRTTSMDVSPNTLPASGFSLVLNDQDVSNGLSLTGTDSSKDRTATYSGLVANQFYQAQIIVADSAGNSSTNLLSFDTFVEADGIAIESEDYNHSDGQFIANPVPGDYAGLAGTAGVDFFDLSTGGSPYRGDAVDGAVSGDTQRQKFIDAGVDDNVVSGVQQGEWLNYTRSYTAGRYLVNLRNSSTATQSLQLGKVTGATTGNQTHFGVGSFLGVRSGNLNLYQWTQMTDAFGDPLSVALSGQETLRLTALGANNNLQHNLLFLVPDPDADSASIAVAAASPAPDEQNVRSGSGIEIALVDGVHAVVPGSVNLTLDGTQVGAMVSDTADGALVTYDPGFLPGLTEHTIQVTFADDNTTPNEVTRTWSFTTAGFANIPPQLGTPVGTGADAGMKWRSHQLAEQAAAVTTSIDVAEQQLAGDLGASVHEAADYPRAGAWVGPAGDDGLFVMNYVNLNIDDGETGQFTSTANPPQDVQDDYIPGVGEIYAGIMNAACEVLAFIQFPAAGVYEMAVNSDDGFRVTTGNLDNPAYLELASFPGTRGTDETVFQLGVSEPGVYLFRLVWFQGSGGADVEWYTVSSDGSRALINGTQPNALASFQRRTVAEPELPSDPPLISPPTLSDGTIVITWTEGGELETAPAVNGPWTTTGNSSGSFSEPVNATGEKFYRVNRGQ